MKSAHPRLLLFFMTGVLSLTVVFDGWLPQPNRAAAQTAPAAKVAVATPEFPFNFVDVAERAGLSEVITYGGIERKKYIIETNGCGVAFFDYDGDGWMDVLLLNGTRLEGFPKGQEPTNRLYRNNRDGTFADVTTKSGLRRVGWASSVCVGDYDNDGDEDLFITYWGQNVLYRNNGDGTFADATQRAGLGTKGTRWGSGCTFIDYDRDGDLDLFVANYLKFDLAAAPEHGKGLNCTWKGIPVNCGPKGLPTDVNLLYRNDGDGRFTDVSESSGVAKVQGRYSMTAVTTDYDNDGWTDIYVACDSTASTLYRNNHDGTFTDVALESGSAYNEDGQPQAGMGVTAGDYNADSLPDLFKTHFSDDLPILYKNVKGQFFEDASRAAGFEHTRYVQWGTGFADFDNDTWPDLFIVTGNVYPEVEKFFKEYPHRSPRLVYRNTGAGRFVDLSAQSGPGVSAQHSSRGCAFGDYDNDGDIDILIMNMNERPSLLRNDYITTANRNRPSNNWLKLKLIGTKSNRSAIGARVTLKIDSQARMQEVTSQTSYYSHNDLRLHFGLGAHRKVDALEIRWPNGQTEKIAGLSGNQIVTIKEGSGVVK
ncbi:MAG: CRTAC1 family protein [Acidobacteriota bacterium]|nr:CRTAC1 family protein [Acidobacteriota bacterium]